MQASLRLITKSMSLILIASLSNTASAMYFFNAVKAYIFSPVQIAITENAKPIKELKVIRRWEWNGKKGEDHAFTNDEGVVEFPEVRENDFSQFFLAEFVAAQQIVVANNGKEDLIWSFSKRSPDKNSELEGIPLKLACDLNDKERMYRDFGPALFTRCTWSE